MKKLPLLAAGAAGYVLGTRAGRERYEQIRTRAGRLAGDPRVQRVTQRAQDAAAQQAAAAAGAARDFAKDAVVSAAYAATDRVRRDRGESL